MSTESAEQPFWTSIQDDRMLDRGLQFGDGLFETLALSRGRIARLPWHLDRLRTGCQRLGMRYPESELNELLTALCSAASKQPSAVGKLVLTRASDHRGYKPTWNAIPRLYGIAYTTTVKANDPTPVQVQVCRLRLAQQPALAGLKHLNRLEQVLARGEWRNPSIFEGLMLDAKGHLIEGTFSNLFLVRDKQMVTPLLDQCGVAGVLRAYLLDTHLHGQVLQSTIKLSDLLKAEEAFICNSLIGIRPIGTIIHGVESTHLAAGPRTLALQQVLTEARD